MRHTIKFALSILILASSSVALACQFDGDCHLGGRCDKPAGSQYGWCTGGLEKQHNYQLQPPRESLNLKEYQGIPCAEDKECGEGGRCIKKNAASGICL